ncbi:MAG: pyridoxal phosphate-dependent aminotransferase [Acidimicrobiales bacterium]
MTQRQPRLNARLQGLGTTVFAAMSALAEATGSINLGQGFPDYDGPIEVLEAARRAIGEGHNQYPPGRGIKALREAISEHQRHFYGLEYDPAAEVLVTIGATEAIAATILALCELGDEVVMFEPYYDVYPAVTAMAGATHRVVRLNPPDWSFDPDELRRAITARTRLVIVNTPHNPTGKVFDRRELEILAEVCNEHDLIAVTDEVYEHLVFDGEHLALATLPDMRDRTVTVSSAAKTFSVTGWKIGWLCASPSFVAAIQTAKQFLSFAGGTPFQVAIAAGLGLPDERIRAVCADLEMRRDRFCGGLAELGHDVTAPRSGYFAITDVGSLGGLDAAEFCATLPERCGVVAIPNHVFYDHKDEARRLVRWAFCKTTDTIDQALGRLATLSPQR